VKAVSDALRDLLMCDLTMCDALGDGVEESCRFDTVSVSSTVSLIGVTRQDCCVVSRSVQALVAGDDATDFPMLGH
jgi:hypothetical protein